MIRNKLLLISLVSSALVACAAEDTPRTAGIPSTSVTLVQEPAPELASSFTDCNDVYNAGLVELPRENPLYDPVLDFDHDGVACEIFDSPTDPVSVNTELGVLAE